MFPRFFLRALSAFCLMLIIKLALVSPLHYTIIEIHDFSVGDTSHESEQQEKKMANAPFKKKV